MWFFHIIKSIDLHTWSTYIIRVDNCILLRADTTLFCLYYYFIIATRYKIIATKSWAIYKLNTNWGYCSKLPLGIGKLWSKIKLNYCIESTNLFKTIIVVGDIPN